MDMERKRLAAVWLLVLLIFGIGLGMYHRSTVIRYQEKQAALSEDLRDMESEIRAKTAEMEALRKELEESSAEIVRMRGLVKNLSSYRLVESVVAAESCGQPIEGQMAVVQTILSRAEACDMTLASVVLAPNQYADPKPEMINESVQQAVERVLLYGQVVYEDPITSFHADYVTPWWASVKSFKGQIGNHLFYE